MLDHILGLAPTGRIWVGAACALLCALAAPAAEARHSPPRAAAAITSCKDDRITLGAKFVGGSRVRGATLTARYKLIPLFGEKQSIVAKLGRRRTQTKSRAFRDLPAGIYWGQVSWRWRKGRKTVGRGVTRTGTQRIGRRRGRGLCVLTVGIPPVDRTKPEVFLEPTDSDWRAGPVDARFHAFDDFSGVREVVYRVNGGPIRTGRTFRLDTEGTHTVEYAVEDRAGNVSDVKRDTLRVDAGAPTAPALVWPPSITSAARPTLVWNASADSGSGVQAYAVVVRDAGGAIVGFETVGGATTQVTLSNALANGTYTAEVSAVDGTKPEARVTASAPRTFTIDTSTPRVTGHDPASGEIVPLATNGRDVTLSFDRPVRPETIGAISFDRLSPGTDPGFSRSCNTSPCTGVTIDPSGALAEGVYQVAWTGALAAEDGTPLASGSFRFSVPFYETNFDDGECGSWTLIAPWTCINAGPFPGNQLRAAPDNRSATDVDVLAQRTTAQTLDFGGGGAVVARMTREFTRRTPDCVDKGILEIRDGAAGVRASAELTSSTGTGDTVFETGNLTGSQAVRAAAQFEQEGWTTCNNPSSGQPPASFHVDLIRLARKP